MSQSAGRFRCAPEYLAVPRWVSRRLAFGSPWIWLAAILGISAMNMLIGILIGCSIVSILLIFLRHAQQVRSRA